MRKDHFVPPAKWTREFRQALKLSDAHFKVYSYLEGGLESHRTGIYFVTLSAVAEMVYQSRDTVATIMEDLEREGLILWDQACDVVFVPCVCEEQFRWSDKTRRREDDFRVVEARRHLRDLPRSHLVEVFLSRFPVFADPSEKPLAKGLGKGHAKGLGKGQLPVTCYPEGKGANPPGAAGPSFRPQDENGLDVDEGDSQ